ncbi:MAG: hypothetical protein KatS3mg053_3757 [Candidatus Roseilinea sp.]|nr:MAG: hypothetical protein KatS3mg053_3757 [Candidatus Roseilinea sp.]
MVNTIHPIVYGKDGMPSRSQWFRAIVAYSASLIMAAVITGGILGAVGIVANIPKNLSLNLRNEP